MKTKPILRAIVFGGGVALLATPAWAGGGGSYGHDRSGQHAGQERTGEHQAGGEQTRPGAMGSGIDRPEAQSSDLDQAKTREVQQALQEKGFEPGHDGVMDSQTREAIAEFQRKNDIPATGSLDEQTAQQLGVEIGSSSSGWQSEGQSGPQSSEGQFMGRGESSGGGSRYESGRESPVQPQ